MKSPLHTFNHTSNESVSYFLWIQISWTSKFPWSNVKWLPSVLNGCSMTYPLGFSKLFFWFFLELEILFSISFVFLLFDWFPPGHYQKNEGEKLLCWLSESVFFIIIMIIIIIIATIIIIITLIQSPCVIRLNLLCKVIVVELVFHQHN